MCSQSQLNFKGLVFNRIALNNGRQFFQFAKEGEVELSAFLAGNDFLLMPLDVVKGLKPTLRKAYNKGRNYESRLSTSVKKDIDGKV